MSSSLPQKTLPLIALTTLLVAVREIAARACIGELPAYTPDEARLQQRRAALTQGLARRLNGLAALDGLPLAARALLPWLAEPTALQDLAHRCLRPGAAVPYLDARAASCVLEAWQHVSDCELPSWFCDERLVTGDQLQETGVCPLISQVKGTEEKREPGSIDTTCRLPLRPLRADVLMASDTAPAGGSYASLWEDLVEGARALPASDTPSDAWLDAFDSLLGSVLHAVPASPFEVPPLDTLVELSRVAGACAVSLHVHKLSNETSDPYRFVVGEFTPIQDFILATDPHTPWRASALAGGRSAFVKLASELAALYILRELKLPPVCRIVSGASKFMLLVPHTTRVDDKLKALRSHFDDWALDALAGAGGILMGWWMTPPTGVSSNSKRWTWSEDDTAEERSRKRLGGFPHRYSATLAKLENSKFHRFRLLEGRSPILDGFLQAVRDGARLCSVDGTSAALAAPPSLRVALQQPAAEAPPLSRAAAFQLELAQQLGQVRQIAIHSRPWDDARPPTRGFDFFGLYVELEEDDMSRRQPPARSCEWVWDVSMATRELPAQRFRGLPMRLVAHHAGTGSAAALAVVKGDVDRLGHVFSHGTPGFCITRMALMSRQLEYFFALYLPWMMRERFPGVQTILAGGDDFAFMGEADEVLALVDAMHKDWQVYTRNPTLTFSVGLHVGRPGMPLQEVDRQAGQALQAAKRSRNAAGLYGRVVEWPVWQQLRVLEERLPAVLAAPAGADPVEAKSALSRLLSQLLQVTQDWNEPRCFIGLRWRASVHHAIGRYCDRPCATVKGPGRDLLFDALVQVLDHEGFERFGADMLIPLGNLLRRLETDSWPSVGLPTLPTRTTVDEAPAPSLDTLLPQLQWSAPSADLFGQVARGVAGAARALPGPYPLDGLTRELRGWDLQCARSEDAFVRMQPRLTAYAARERPSDTAALTELRRTVMARITSAGELHCARWFFETVALFNRHQRRPRASA